MKKLRSGTGFLSYVVYSNERGGGAFWVYRKDMNSLLQARHVKLRRDKSHELCMGHHKKKQIEEGRNHQEG